MQRRRDGVVLNWPMRYVAHASTHKSRCLVLPVGVTCKGDRESGFLALGVKVIHHGAHDLRHACATRLIADGLTLKEIGDHLGHRSTETTRTYAKVDLAALREVGNFDLGELL